MVDKIIHRYAEAPAAKRFLREGEDEILVAEVVRTRSRNAALEAENARLREVNANLMGDDEDAPRYTTKRLKQEIAKAVARTEASAAVKVGPLEWKNVQVNYGPETYEAKTPVGFYQVFVDDDSAAGSIFAEWAWDQDQFGMTGATTLGRYATFPDAEAAAQADFERRIFSALSPAPQEAEAVAWRDDITCHCVSTYGPNPECGKCGGSGCFSGLAHPPAPAVTEASTAARFTRLNGIVSRLKWVGATDLAVDDEATQAALQDLAEYLFADGIDAALQSAQEVKP